MESLEQLQKTYAGKTDEELAELASDAYDLMEPAPQVLGAEIAKRGLKITLKQAADAQPESSTSEDGDEHEDPDSELEVAASVRSPQEARLLQAALNSAGIRSCLGPDNAEDVDSFRGTFDQPVALKVYFPFQARARYVINRTRIPPEFQHDPDHVEDEEEEEEDVVASIHCPKCLSKEIVFEGREAEPGSEPGPDAKFDWHCDGCGHVWEDDGFR